ncbi:Beta-elicitin DRE-beta [Phytophthora citrophthora]|uniref:Elicitin n=1 Tax=Phytophthora citrophthora TaxID=4793 RepID=A0AAD9G2C5_9STRA|nr:Beta-elicitin DRE-beta [Phytophthora citrophthora]
MSAFVVNGENCTVQLIYSSLEPISSDPNFSTCQSDSNYSLLSFSSPSLSQIQGFCASSACQTLLNTTVSSGLIPNCDVVLGQHSLNLTQVITVASKCTEAALEERAVSKDEDHHGIGHTADTIAGIVGHSVPMDALDTVLAFLKCISQSVRSLRQERAVDNTDKDSKAQRISGHVATVLGHSAPMDEVGNVVGLLLGV